MYAVFTCIVTEHDLRLVVLAAVICTLASFAAISLLHHMRRSGPRLGRLWLVVAATSTGFGIWATHFIAMLAFAPGVPTAYNIVLTALSLAAAIVLTGIGLAVAVTPGAGLAALGGAMVGAGIAAMHYTGMAAFEIAGRIIWDPVLVTVSVALGGLIGAAALAVGLAGSELKRKIFGALLLTVAICSHHFTAMGAVTIVPDPGLQLSETALPAGLLAVAVAMASVVIILLALGGVGIEMRERRRRKLEAERMRGLANAAVEGLLVCDGDIVVSANDNFAALIGSTSADGVTGTRLGHYFPDSGLRARLFTHPNELVESFLVGSDGAEIPVELVQRPVDLGGKPHQAIAVRDLRRRKEAEKSIFFLAHHDPLTGLPNRRSFNERLDREIEAALATGSRLAVMCLDLDRFKDTNELFGHAAGDRLLQAVARRVGAVLDGKQMLARLGGDEFALIVPRLPGPSAAEAIASAILDGLAAPGEGTDAQAPIAASLGIALCPDDATDRQTLLSHADTALYRAKSEGRGTFCTFEASMGAALRERRLLEHDLRKAVSRGELRLVYQPQKDVRTGLFVGFEALLRWTHPLRGNISPAEFIPIAEETGIILQIGEWVLRQACREAATWSRPLTIAVNVSAAQMHSPAFAHLVHETLFETGLNPGRLELEVTETALVRDLNRALATLRRIKMLGVRIAMDDFGTGYSSLSNLRAFPFDKIKIDASFIHAVNANEEAAAIVRSVLGLGRALRLPVLAEGVETTAELDFLRSELCDEVQGYLLGKPGEIESFRALTHGDAAASPDATAKPRRQAVASLR